MSSQFERAGSAYLVHHGILGMHWGVRRFQNDDGSLTDAGRLRYYGKKVKDRIKARAAARKQDRKMSGRADPSSMSDDELRSAISRMQLEKQYAQLGKELNPEKKHVVVDFLKKNAGDYAQKYVSKWIETSVNNKFKEPKGEPTGEQYIKERNAKIFQFMETLTPDSVKDIDAYHGYELDAVKKYMDLYNNTSLGYNDDSSAFNVARNASRQQTQTNFSSGSSQPASSSGGSSQSSSSGDQRSQRREQRHQRREQRRQRRAERRAQRLAEEYAEIMNEDVESIWE